MAIYRVGNKSPLVKAATGVEPPPQPKPTDTAMGQAMMQKLMPAPSYGDFMSQAGLTTQPLSSTMGLSPEGKYGGFYTASDLDKAIRGETMSRNQELLDYASSLRELASKQRGQLQGALSSQVAGTAERLGRAYTMPYAPMTQETEAYGKRRMAELAQGDVLAEQIEATPTSQLAQAIATRKYGVNPALAAGMYGTEYDIESQKALRDQYYYETGQGYGYEDAMAQQEREQRDLTDFIAQAKRTQDPNELYAASEYSQEVRDLYYNQLASDKLNMNAAKLFSAAQVTPEQGYALLNTPIPTQDGDVTFSDLANNALAAVQAGDEGAAFAAADALSFEEDLKKRMLGRLLATYVDSLVRQVGKTGRGLYQYQTASDILG